MYINFTVLFCFWFRWCTRDVTMSDTNLPNAATTGVIVKHAGAVTPSYLSRLIILVADVMKLDIRKDPRHVHWRIGLKVSSRLALQTPANILNHRYTSRRADLNILCNFRFPSRKAIKLKTDHKSTHSNLGQCFQFGLGRLDIWENR
uniref:Secreted protein n=1 Tax=Glossina pallidipes TaxID=7398 RepID=A0A1A9ZF65_GLOPL